VTVIAGLVGDDTIWLGADEQASSGNVKQLGVHKLIRVGAVLFGAQGAPVETSALQRLITERGGADELEYPAQVFKWITDMMPHLYAMHFTAMAADGEAHLTPWGFDFLLANPYGLFHVTQYRDVLPVRTYHAIGSGREAALGSLYTTDDMPGISPADRVTLAVQAALYHTVSCGGQAEVRTVKRTRPSQRGKQET
jgi:ATP-dependent protease HslVU (ClpYQ) peptidase subunit